MTEENSEFSDSDESIRQQRRVELAEKAGLTEKEIEDGVKVLELRSLAWRARKVCAQLLRCPQHLPLVG